MDSTQTPLRRPPATRYQGSKFKLLPELSCQFEKLEFTTALDAFAGTGSVAYLLKSLGKQVTANDYLYSNQLSLRALIENQETVLTDNTIDAILKPQPGRDYDDLIQRTFAGIYFTDEENRWLDVVAQNLPHIPEGNERALAYYALFQAAIAKRPYNLFHRRNLYMRTAQVQRSFGNKATWDTPFEDHFRRHAAAANATIFDSGVACRATCEDVLDVNTQFDLVYIDSPYINGRGTGVDYRDFYHFLEGLVDYKNWGPQIDHTRKHRPLTRARSPWTDPRQIHTAFDNLFARFAESIMVVSYRSDGIPSIDELTTLLQRHKSRVQQIPLGRYQYALSKNNRSQEVLLIGR
ncbi:DNA adenine methylase [Symmachiella dynata]|uniref:DNA adenine methylase n=1 Tax=Symmachiella dynata TaxID=2527995 RepID=UPI0030ED200D